MLGGCVVVQSELDDSRRLKSRQLIVTLVAFAIPLLATVAPLEIAGLDPWGVRVLAVVLAGLILWVSESLPLAVTSVAILAMLALVRPGPSDEAIDTALAGFQSPAPFFLLGSLALGRATVTTGLARRFARLIVRGARGSGRRLYAQMIAMMPPMAILVPSALTRSAMLIPAYESVYRSYRIERGHPLPRLMMLATATLQVQASTAVLTGGAVPVLAASLLGGFSWARWFLFMAVPNYVTLFVFAGALYLLYRPLHLPRIERAEREHADDAEAEPGPMTPAEWRALIIICSTTVLWLTDAIHHLNPTIPALVGATVLFLPRIGVLTWDDFDRSGPWPIFLVTGSSLSLAVSLDQSGAATWIASTMVEQLPLDRLPLIPLLLTFILMTGFVNIILPNRTAVLGITIPLVMSLAGTLGLNPLTVGLMVPIVAQTTIFYPVQIATALITFRTRHYSAGELARAGVILTAVSVMVLFLVALPWWSLLGEPVRP
jgi:solute carrier family 13 (sodium-dependent dicarboxylate transporter), member 2/3/5